MSVMKFVKIKNENGTVTDTIPIGADATNVSLADGRSVEQAILDLIDASDLAPAFNVNSAYAAGEYVSYNHALYKITSAHSAGTSWANTAKTAVYLARELKSSVSENIGNINSALASVQNSLNAKVDRITLNGLRLEFYSGNTQLGYCELADKSIPYEKLSTSVQASINKMNDAMTKSVYDPHGYGQGSSGVDPYTYSNNQNTVLKNQIVTTDQYTVNGTNYTGLKAALQGVLSKAKSYGDGLIQTSTYNINGTNYTGVLAALKGVLTQANNHSDNNKTAIISSQAYSVNGTTYTGLVNALQGVLLKAKSYSEGLIQTSTYTVNGINYTGVLAALRGVLTQANNYSDNNKTAIISSQTYSVDGTNYTGLKAAFQGVLSKAKNYGDGLIQTSTYSVNGTNYTGVLAALRGVLTQANGYSDSNKTSIISNQTYTVDGTNYTGLINALQGVLLKAKNYSDSSSTDNYTIDGTDYNSLIAALEGILSKSKDYTDETLEDYTPFSISIVSSLPTTGEDKTFYLIRKDGEDNYEKWWYVDDGSGGKTWDKFGGSSTKIVNSLPVSGSTEIDYILKTDAGYAYYKWINNSWQVIAGSLAAFVDELPSSGNEYTDYYVKEEDTDIYIHYRYKDGSFVQIGGAGGNDDLDVYSTAEVDGFISTLNGKINTNTQNITNISDNVSTLSGRVTSLQQTLNELDTTVYEYEATYKTETIEGRQVENVYTLYKKEKGSSEQGEIVSRFVIQGGGGSGGGQASTLTVRRITPSPYVVTKNDQILLQFEYSSINSAQEDVSGSYTWKIGNRIIGTGSCLKGINTFDATEFVTNIGLTSLNLTVSDEGGSVALRTFTVQKVDLYIESSFNDKTYIELGQKARFRYIPHGNVSKTIHFKLDGVETTETTSVSNETLEREIPAQSYGAHLLQVWITATINNTEIETNHIYKDIIWYSTQAGGDPIIACIYRHDYYGDVPIKQYDSLPITYYVYDPATNYPIVKRYLDNNLIDSVTLRDNEDTWNFQSGIIGRHTLKLECKNTSLEIIVDVQQLGIDISPVTSGLEIDFNPAGLTNTSENRLWSNEQYHMIASNDFDWVGGGYQIDEYGDSYFLIRAGSYVTFDYNMFTGGVENNPTRKDGAEIKICFMVENVQDINAVWLSNVQTTSMEVVNEETGTSQTKNVNLGLQMSAHEGWLKTNKARTAEEGDDSEGVAASNTYLYMPYSEQDIIEIDINIDPISGGSDPKGFILSYEDGVPSKAYVYDSADRFYQQTPQAIKIGSDKCDIRIYRMKIYSRSLSTTEVMRNFIADSRNSTTMLNRYNRNCIYYDNENQEYTPYRDKGILDPEKLAARVPNVKILMLETDHFTTSKKTFVKSSLRCIHAPGGKVYEGDEYEDNWYFENGYHSGQGTTSDNYGQSGRNVDFLFNCDGTHKPSDKVEAESNYISKITKGYLTDSAFTETCTDWKGSSGKTALTRSSIPNNFFNLKVNIASSENVNNWLLQKRYNDFLPYISPAKERDSRVKNDMEFVPAILFLKETNTETIDQNNRTLYTQHKEFNDTNWHFYALGNIGDSKKTDYTRAYDPTDMNEFTIQISDNTKNNATFQTGVYLDNNNHRQIETFTIREEDGKTISLPDVQVFNFAYPVTEAEWNDSRNYRHWTLENEDFDGDHSFEPRYACCGDYRDGKLVNDTSGRGKAQVATNAQVWKAFYKWVVTSTDAQFIAELDQWCVRSAVEFFYAFTHYYTMMDNRAKNTFWHFAKTGTYRQVSRPVPELLHIYCELKNGEYVTTTDTAITSGKTYYTQYAFDLWDYDNDTALGINNNGELIFPYGKEDTDYNIDGNPSSGWIFNGADSVFWCRLRDLLSNEISNTFSTVSNECFNADNLINQFDTMQECYPEEIWRLDIQRKYIRTFTGESIDNSITEGKQNDQFLRDMMQGRKKYQRRQWVRDQEMYFGTKYLMNNVTGDNNRITFRCYNPGANAAVPPNYSLRITPFSDMYVSAMFGNGDTRQQRAKAGQQVTLNFSVSTATDTQVTIYGANRIAALNDLSACYITAPNFSTAIKLKKLVLGNTTSGYTNARLQSLTLGNNKMLEELDVRNCTALAGGLNLTNSINLLRLYAENTQISAVMFAINGKLQLAHLPNTIETLVMRGLNNLTDFQCSLNSLYSLTLQGGALNNQQIIENTLDTLQELRLYNIDWTLANSNLLNSILALSYSSVTGRAHISAMIKSGESAQYSEKWPDLEVTSEGIVQQFLVSYVNDDEDHTVLYSQYYDQGEWTTDPYFEGKIAKPTKEKDDRFSYSFGQYAVDGSYIEWSGWENGSNSRQRVSSNLIIKATYQKTTRTFTVNWYASQGKLLQTQSNISYGTPVQFSGDIPTRKDEEANLKYYLFNGWDQHTGSVTKDMDVYAVWDQFSGLPRSGKEMKDMSPIEIYAVARSDAQDQYWQDCDYVDITLGKDFNFQNVDTIEIGKDYLLPSYISRDKFSGNNGYYFNGSQSSAVRSNLTLFGNNDPSFTMAIDFQFGENISTSGQQTLISTYERNPNISENNSAEFLTTGFRIYRDNTTTENYVYLEWGGSANNKITIGRQCQRDIVVLRYNKDTPNYIYVYGSYYPFSHPSYAFTSSYTPSIVNTQSFISNFRTSTEPISFGAIPYSITNQGEAIFINSCKATLHWCKIWKSDLGSENAALLATWPREKIRFEYCGKGRFNKTNAQTYDDIPTKGSWISSSLLGTFQPRTFSYFCSSSNQNGYANSYRRDFLRDRILKAFPFNWQSAISAVRVPYTISSNTTSTLPSEQLYLPAYRDLGGSSYTTEIAPATTPISWFTTNANRIKFYGIPRTYQETIVQAPAEPTNANHTMYDYGTIWHNTSNYSYYILLSGQQIKQYNLIFDTDKIVNLEIMPSGGAWIIAGDYDTRTCYSSTYYHYEVVNTGNLSTSYYYTYSTGTYNGVCFGFSI